MVADLTIFLSDRFRTTVNVLGDAYGAGIVAKLAENDLALMSYTEAADIGNVFGEKCCTTTSM